MSGGWAVVLVHSTSHAVRIERLLSRSGLSSKLIPVPRHLGSNCGVCLRIDRHDKEEVGRLLAEHAIEIAALEDWS